MWIGSDFHQCLWLIRKKCGLDLIFTSAFGLYCMQHAKKSYFYGVKKKNQSVFVHVITNISIKLFFLCVIYLLSLTVEVVILKNILFKKKIFHFFHFTAVIFVIAMCLL